VRPRISGTSTAAASSRSVLKAEPKLPPTCNHSISHHTSHHSNF